MIHIFFNVTVFLFTLSIGGAGGPLAWGSNERTPTLDEFRATVRNHYSFEVVPSTELERLKSSVGEVTYISHHYLLAGQSRFSYLSVLRNILRAPERYSLKWDEKTNSWKLPSDDGRALLPKSRQALGVLASWGVVLIDGHHKVLESLYFGAKTAPVEILADWSYMGEGRFWREMEKHRYTFLHTLEGEKLDTPPALTEMEDDPLRDFFRSTSLRVETKYEDGRYRVTKRSGPDKNPLAIRVDKRIPFFELHGSQALYRGGFSHIPTLGEDLTKDQLSEARKILLGEREKGDEILGQMLLLEGDEDLSDGGLEALINDWGFIYPFCSDVLLYPPSRIRSL